MLKIRGTRTEINKYELFIHTLNNSLSSDNIKETKLNKSTKLLTYSYDWDETYINNFLLNRFSNIRISDETIYHANKIGYSNTRMINNFFENLIDLLPTPIINFVFYSVKSKDNRKYSRGDLIANRTDTPSYLVTSLIGDGLATFGYSFFIILLIIFYIYFKLLNSFIFFKNENILLSPLALIIIFKIFGSVRNADGIFDQIAFIIRGFWEAIFIFYFAKKITSF